MEVRLLTDLNLHDTIVKKVTFVEFGTASSEVVLDLDYVESYDDEDLKFRHRTLVFRDCLYSHLDLNMNTGPSDSIFQGYEFSSSALLESKAAAWRALGDSYWSSARHLRIEMNTSGSVIEVICQNVELLDDPAAP